MSRSDPRITLRFAPAELEALERRAAEAGESVGVFCKKACLRAGGFRPGRRKSPPGSGVRSGGEAAGARASHVQVPPAGSRPAPAAPSSSPPMPEPTVVLVELLELLVDRLGNESLAMRACRLGKVILRNAEGLEVRPFNPAGVMVDPTRVRVVA